ncbi:MAG: AsmA-like C-terminal domain-containing protein [Alphaproteobacteria bacterium]|nr:AsmA-like C-terminal domain-containing protein [Alphaproteobacteria bacterium]
MNKVNLSLIPSFGKWILSKKAARLFLEVIGSLFGLLCVVLLLLLGRLSMGPIHLDFITADIEAAFKAPEAGLSATIGSTQLVWHSWDRPFEIELINVELQKGENSHWLKIDQVGVSLRLYRLLAGDISLKQIRLYRPHILLERDETGQFSLGFGSSSANQEFSFEEMAPLLALGGSNTQLGKLNDLSKISIMDAHILLKDEKEGQSWELPKATFTLKRKTKGFKTLLTLKAKEGHGSLTLGLDHDLGSARFDAFADFHHISFKELIEKDRPTLNSTQTGNTTIDDLLNFFQHWDIPLHGKAHVALIPETLQAIEGACNINIGKGELDLSLAKLLPLPVSSGNLSVILSPHGIELKKASLLSEEMLVQLSGKLSSPESPILLKNLLGFGQSLEIQGKIDDLLLDHLSAVWPQGLAHHARKWLTENMRTGTLTEAIFTLKGHGEEKGFTLDSLQGTLAGEGAEITYLEGLPPAEKVKAFATFDKQGFDIKILSGSVKDIHLQEGHILISKLDTDDEDFSLDVKAKGPLSDILDVIDHKPLEYATYGGIDPKKTKGEGEVNLHLDFPLISTLQFKDVKMDLKGAMKNVVLERKITDDLTAQLGKGNLTIDLTHNQMTIQGKGVLNELPSNLTYKHYFTQTRPYELQIQVETTASFEDFSRMGFDYREYASGPTKTKLTYTHEKDDKTRLILDINTTPATLLFPPLEWEKKAGEKGELSFAVVFKDQQLAKIKELKMTSPTYSLQGEIHFDAHKEWKTVLLSEFKGPHTQTQVVLHTPHKNNYEVTFKGQSVDLEKFLEYVEKEENAKDHPHTDIKLSAQVDQLRLGEDKIFHNVKASAELFLKGQDTLWKSVSLRAKAGTGTSYKGDMAHVSGGIVFDIKPGNNNTQTLEVRANDAGQFLKNLSIYEDIRGGYIIIKAQRKDHGPFKGEFRLKDFEAKQVPLLARFAALLSPMGIANFFSEHKTLSMDRFGCDFEFSEDLITVKKGIGKSMSLGFTVAGKLDRKKRLFALKGNIVVARFLNSILSNIPLIGHMLNGGDGEGLFGIAYTVTDSFDAPNVSLNPLSVLAPGFIRKFFQSLGGDE